MTSNCQNFSPAAGRNPEQKSIAHILSYIFLNPFELHTCKKNTSLGGFAPTPADAVIVKFHPML